jgi:hypothetical protein
VVRRWSVNILLIVVLIFVDIYAIGAVGRIVLALWYWVTGR